MEKQKGLLKEAFEEGQAMIHSQVGDQDTITSQKG